MDEGKLIADFIAKNIQNIWSLGEKAFGKVDEDVKIKLKLAYTDYLKNVQERYSKSKSFFIRSQAVDLYSYYVPTGVQCSTALFNEPSFGSLIEHSKRLVITGTGGCGKSVLMRHLILDCIKHQEYVPVSIELRDLNSSTLNLDDFIIQRLDSLGFDTSGNFVEKAKRAGHFCFFFDGYDEVNHSLRHRLMNAIKKLTDKYSKCPLVISSRPDDVFNGVEDLSIFKLLPLDLNSAVKLIKKLPFDEEIKTKFAKNLKDELFEKHQSFLSNPLLLSIMLLTYGENAEIPSKLSIFYNQAYEALFQRHDAGKGGYSRERLTDLDIQDFARVFSLFSLQTYEKRLFKMSRTDCLNFIEKARDNYQHEFSAEDYLNDLLSAACLLIEDGLEISYSHRSFQEYFVAVFISNAAPDVQRKLIQRYSSNIAHDDVLFLLLEMNPELIERELLVTRLRKMFNEIGVKRKVGISHGAKYVKRVYTSLNVEPEKLTASGNTKGCGNDSILLHLAVDITQSYKFPDEEYFDNHTSNMNEKYGSDNGGMMRYETTSMSYKTPIMKDTLESKGAFSIAYIQAGFEALKKLEKKHSKASENLSELLGI